MKKFMEKNNVLSWQESKRKADVDVALTKEHVLHIRIDISDIVDNYDAPVDVEVDTGKKILVSTHYTMEKR